VVDEENTVGGQLAVELRRLVEPHIDEPDSVEEETATLREEMHDDQAEADGHDRS
jgi:hypothetical protein